VTGFIFKSTTVVMKFLEKIFDSNLKITGAENIPDAPVLFVANHFTRAETFILPYMMHRAVKRKVRSLADDKIFVGALGKYLSSMGTIATNDPNRNRTIIGDLLTGKSDWLIYPEGIMVKNKHVVKAANYHVNMPGGKQRRIKTGSAVLAIKAELLKKNFFKLGEENNSKEIAKLKKHYFIDDEDNISPKNLHIVPITINYYPIRPGNNSIHSITKRFVKKLSDRILEELEIEGNIITNSEVIIKFGEAINVYDYIKPKRQLVHKLPFVSGEVKNNLLINYYRYRLTNSFMDEIYGNVELNMDHIFACSLYYYHKDEIDRSALKNLIYVNARDIKKLGKFEMHHSIDKDLAMVFMAKENIFYDSIIKLAIDQGIISKEHDHYFINRKKFKDFIDFHQGR